MNTPVLTIHRAESFSARLFGLLSRPRLSDDEALYLTPCSSIHTLFMPYSIDIAFVDQGGRVLKVVHDLKPFRATWCRGARGAIEFLAGAAQRHGIQEGSEVGIAPVQGLQA